MFVNINSIRNNRSLLEKPFGSYDESDDKSTANFMGSKHDDSTIVKPTLECRQNMYTINDMITNAGYSTLRVNIYKSVFEQNQTVLYFLYITHFVFCILFVSLCTMYIYYVIGHMSMSLSQNVVCLFTIGTSIAVVCVLSTYMQKSYVKFESGKNTTTHWNDVVTVVGFVELTRSRQFYSYLGLSFQKQLIGVITSTSLSSFVFFVFTIWLQCILFVGHKYTHYGISALQITYIFCTFLTFYDIPAFRVENTFAGLTNVDTEFYLADLIQNDVSQCMFSLLLGVCVALMTDIMYSNVSYSMMAAILTPLKANIIHLHDLVLLKDCYYHSQPISAVPSSLTNSMDIMLPIPSNDSHSSLHRCILVFTCQSIHTTAAAQSHQHLVALTLCIELLLQHIGHHYKEYGVQHKQTHQGVFALQSPCDPENQNPTSQPRYVHLMCTIACDQQIALQTALPCLQWDMHIHCGTQENVLFFYEEIVQLFASTSTSMNKITITANAKHALEQPVPAELMQTRKVFATSKFHVIYNNTNYILQGIMTYLHQKSAQTSPTLYVHRSRMLIMDDIMQLWTHGSKEGLFDLRVFDQTLKQLGYSPEFHQSEKVIEYTQEQKYLLLDRLTPDFTQPIIVLQGNRNVEAMSLTPYFRDNMQFDDAASEDSSTLDEETDGFANMLSKKRSPNIHHHVITNTGNNTSMEDHSTIITSMNNNTHDVHIQYLHNTSAQSQNSSQSSGKRTKSPPLVSNATTPSTLSTSSGISMPHMPSLPYLPTLVASIPQYGIYCCNSNNASDSSTSSSEYELSTLHPVATLPPPIGMNDSFVVDDDDGYEASVDEDDTTTFHCIDEDTERLSTHTSTHGSQTSRTSRTNESGEDMGKHIPFLQRSRTSTLLQSYGSGYTKASDHVNSQSATPFSEIATTSLTQNSSLKLRDISMGLVSSGRQSVSSHGQPHATDESDDAASARKRKTRPRQHSMPWLADNKNICAQRVTSHNTLLNVHSHNLSAEDVGISKDSPNHVAHSSRFINTNTVVEPPFQSFVLTSPEEVHEMYQNKQLPEQLMESNHSSVFSVPDHSPLAPPSTLPKIPNQPNLPSLPSTQHLSRSVSPPNHTVVHHHHHHHHTNNNNNKMNTLHTPVPLVLTSVNSNHTVLSASPTSGVRSVSSSQAANSDEDELYDLRGSGVNNESDSDDSDQSIFPKLAYPPRSGSIFDTIYDDNQYSSFPPPDLHLMFPFISNQSEEYHSFRPAQHFLSPPPLHLSSIKEEEYAEQSEMDTKRTTKSAKSRSSARSSKSTSKSRYDDFRFQQMMGSQRNSSKTNTEYKPNVPLQLYDCSFYTPPNPTVPAIQLQQNCGEQKEPQKEPNPAQDRYTAYFTNFFAIIMCIMAYVLLFSLAYVLVDVYDLRADSGDEMNYALVSLGVAALLYSLTCALGIFQRTQIQFISRGSLDVGSKERSLMPQRLDFLSSLQVDKEETIQDTAEKEFAVLKHNAYHHLPQVVASQLFAAPPPRAVIPRRFAVFMFLYSLTLVLCAHALVRLNKANDACAHLYSSHLYCLLQYVTCTSPWIILFRICSALSLALHHTIILSDLEEPSFCYYLIVWQMPTAVLGVTLFRERTLDNTMQQMNKVDELQYRIFCILHQLFHNTSIYTLFSSDNKEEDREEATTECTNLYKNYSNNVAVDEDVTDIHNNNMNLTVCPHPSAYSTKRHSTRLNTILSTYPTSIVALASIDVAFLSSSIELCAIEKMRVCSQVNELQLQIGDKYNVCVTSTCTGYVVFHSLQDAPGVVETNAYILDEHITVVSRSNLTLQTENLVRQSLDLLYYQSKQSCAKYVQCSLALDVNFVTVTTPRVDMVQPCFISHGVTLTQQMLQLKTHRYPIICTDRVAALLPSAFQVKKITALNTGPKFPNPHQKLSGSSNTAKHQPQLYQNYTKTGASTNNNYINILTHSQGFEKERYYTLCFARYTASFPISTQSSVTFDMNNNMTTNSSNTNNNTNHEDILYTSCLVDIYAVIAFEALPPQMWIYPQHTTVWPPKAMNTVYW